MALEQELAAFQRELPRLLDNTNNRGKFVLIHGDRVDSVWDTREEGLQAGYSKFALDPFLVKEIIEHEQPVYFSHNLAPCR